MSPQSAEQLRSLADAWGRMAEDIRREANDLRTEANRLVLDGFQGPAGNRYHAAIVREHKDLFATAGQLDACAADLRRLVDPAVAA